MSSRHKKVPGYLLHKATGQALVVLNGKFHYLGKYGSDRSRQQYASLISDWQNGYAGVSRPPELSVNQILNAYRAHAEEYYGKSHKGQAYNSRPIMRLLREEYGTLQARKFGPRRLKEVIQLLIQRGNNRGYINMNLHRVKKIFKWAVSEEMISPAVYQALATVEGLKKGRSKAPESRTIEPIDDETVRQTLPFMAPMIRDMVQLQRLTGARPGEICLLRPVDVDQDNAIWEYRPHKHKTEHRHKHRVIMLGPRAQKLLQPYLDKSESNKTYCFCPRRNKPQAGSHYKPDSYRRAIHRACQRAQIPRWSPHRLRHSAATEIRSKFGLDAAQVTLGHSHARITEVYAERDQNQARIVAHKIG